MKLFSGYQGLLFALLIIICTPRSALGENRIAETGNPVRTNYSWQQYGSGNQVWSVVEGPKGVMYFQTKGHILEFDAYEWRAIPLPVASGGVLAIDRDHTMYVGLSDYFGRINVTEKGELRFQSLVDDLPEEVRAFGRVWNILPTRHGVYISAVRGLLRYKNGLVEVVHDVPIYMAFEVDDLVFVVGEDRRISVLYNDKTIPIPFFDQFTADPGLGRVRITGFRRDGALVLTQNQGAFVVNLSSILSQLKSPKPPVPEKISVTRFRTQADDFIAAHLLSAALKLNDNRYAIAVKGGGILIIDGDGHLIRVINKNRGLRSNVITAMTLDRFGNLWATTFNGISRIEWDSPVSEFNSLNGLDNIVNGFIRHDDDLYVGTTSGVFRLIPHELSREDDKTRFEPVEGTLGSVWRFTNYQGNLLCGRGRDLLRIRDTGAEVLTQLASPIYSLVSSRQFPNLLFVGTQNGLESVSLESNEQTGELEARPMALDAARGVKSTIHISCVDGNGDIWLGVRGNGLARIHRGDEDGSKIELKHYGVENGLPSPDRNFPHCIDGKLSVATPVGVYELGDAQGSADSGSHHFTEDDAFSPLHSHEKVGVTMMRKDISGDIWVVNLEALGPIRTQDDGSKTWDTTLIREYSGRIKGFHIDDDGVVWASTPERILRYDPTMAKTGNTDYETLLRRVEVKDIGIVHLGASIRDPLELEFLHNGISFEYVAAYHKQPEETLYATQLVGLEEDWSEWTKDRLRTFDYLPEGTYAFVAKAKNVYGREVESAPFRFRIAPPWYRTVVAYISYLLGLLALLYVGIVVNTRRLQSAKRKLEGIVRSRTKEVSRQRDEIAAQKDLIEEAKNELWGEMKLAKKIQTALIPEDPKIPGYDIAGYMEPAEEVGGDYYDVINVEGKNWLVIGDVSGHGVPSGLVMMMVQTAIRTVLSEYGRLAPDELLCWVNRCIYENIKRLGESKYMTATIMSVEKDGQIYYAGHHQDILILRKSSGKVEAIETDGSWIGMWADIEGMNEVQSINLEPGDTMLMYTDGLLESRDENRKMYSDERLVEIFSLCHNQTTGQVLERILDSLQDYTTDDDITLLLVKRLIEN